MSAGSLKVHEYSLLKLSVRCLGTMKEKYRRVPKDQFKGKKFECAPTEGVNLFTEIAEDFIRQIFGFEPEEYMITDESILSDFIGLEDITEQDIHKRVAKLYDVDISDIRHGNLVEIFKRIHHAKFGKPR